MKKILICILAILICQGAFSQKKRYDTVALIIMDRMSQVIGDMESCSFKLNTAQDVKDANAGTAKKFADYDVYMSGPTKMLINVHGFKGHRTFKYNGDELAFYSFEEHNYALIKGFANIVSTMDSINSLYDIEFPAADFFYPAFTDDMIENSDSILYLGIERIGGNEYFHILADSKDNVFQFWIKNDSYTLPGIFSVTYKKENGKQYLATFSDWQVNPSLPSAMFEFMPPPGARQIRLMAKRE